MRITADQPILVTRTDRFGDLLLALPSIQFLRREFPNNPIDLLCRSDLIEVVAGYLRSIDVGALPVEALRPNKYQASLVLYADGKTLKILKDASIPYRVGGYSKLASLFSFGKGIVQHRSRSAKSESEYNLDLARYFSHYLLGTVATNEDLTPVVLPVDAETADAANQALGRLGIAKDESYGVVHPGMGGSALNLPVSRYVDCIRMWMEKVGVKVVLSCGPSPQDREMVQGILKLLPDLPVLYQQSLPVLREVFRRAHFVIAPSTGPLHLAHYVGTPTIGLFSPVRSHHLRRWAPAGGAGPTVPLSPYVNCRGKTACLGQRCQYFNCMEKMDWQTHVLNAAHELSLFHLHSSGG